MEMLSELRRPPLEEGLLAMSSLLRLLKGFSGLARSLEAALAAMSDRLAKDLDLPVKKFDNPLLEVDKEERSMQDYNYILIITLIDHDMIVISIKRTSMLFDCNNHIPSY